MAIPLIIAGQARAGTTALAHVLATNPDIELYTSGSEAHLLECDELEHDKRCAESAASLRAAIAASGAYLCAAKRPWCEEDPEFFAAHFPDAIYILCRRNAADLVRSWQDCALTWTVQGGLRPSCMRSSPGARCWLRSSHGGCRRWARS